MASRISVEIAGTSASLQEAAAKAASALQGLGDELAKQAGRSGALNDDIVKSNQRLASSYGGIAAAARDGAAMATDAWSASADTQMTSAERIQAASERIAAAARGAGTAAAESAVEQDDAAARASAAYGEQADAASAAADKQVEASVRSADSSKLASDAAVKGAAKSTAAAERSAAGFGAAGSGITKAGKTILLTTAAVSLGSLDMAAKFQASTLRLQTQAGATTAQLAKLRQGLLNMAGQVGFSPDQLSSGMYHVVSSLNKMLPPLERVNGELKVTKMAAELAQVGGSSLEETTYALASAMNALHEPISGTTRVAGELNAIVGTGDMTMQDLVDALSTGVIPAARESGISLQSLGAAMAVMGDMGQRGALAGTRLRMAIALMSGPSEAAAKILDTVGLSSKQVTSDQAAMAEALRKAGLSTTTLSADLHKPDGILIALEDLRDHLIASGLTSTGAAAVMDKAFGGARTGATITELLQNTGRLNAGYEQIGKSAGQFGADWQKTSQSFRMEIDKMVASVEALGVKLGTALMPYARDAIHDLSDLTHWFTESKARMDALAITVGGFALLTVGSYLVSKLRQAISLFRTLGKVAAAPWKAASWIGQLGSGSAKTTAAGQTAAQAALGGVWGEDGPEKPGSIANPIIVAIKAGEYAGLGSQGAAGTVASEEKVAQAETGAVERAAGAGATVEAAAGTGAAELAPVAEGALGAGGIFASLKSGLPTVIEGAMKGGMIAAGGMLASQIISSVVPGKAGHVASSVVGDASIGAGLGMLVGPEGAVVGGLGGAAVGALTSLLGGGKSKGTQLADQVTAGFAPEISKQFAPAISKALDAGISASAPKLSTTLGENTGWIKQMDARDGAQRAKDFEKAGQLAGAAFVENFAAVKFPSGSAMASDFEAKLGSLPPDARDAAAATMLQFAQGLQDNGSLPAGAVSKLIGQLEGQFPGLGTYLQQQGLATDAELSQALELQQSRASLQQAVDALRTEFGYIPRDAQVSSQNMTQELRQGMSFLTGVIQTSTGQQRQAAVQAYGQLHDQALSYFTDLGTQTQARMGALSTAVQSGSKDAVTKSQIYWQRFVGEIGNAEKSGALSVKQGSKLIADELQSALKNLGSSALATAGSAPYVTPKQAQQALTHVGGTNLSAGTVFGHSDGGYIGSPGERGHDEVPIVVGRGEAILNHAQQGVVNAALATHGIAGLPGLFSKVTTPHYMASGGYADGGIAVPTVAGSGAMRTLAQTALNTDAAAAADLLGADGSSAQQPAGAGTPVHVAGSLQSWLMQAMKLTGVSGSLWLNTLERQAMRESSGNPGAVNRTDINAQQGNPSEGLLQTTLSTFATYALAGHRNILNPVDNAAAAIRYMIARYGNGNPNLAAQVMWNRGGGAYAQGGLVDGGDVVGDMQEMVTRIGTTKVLAPAKATTTPSRHGKPTKAKKPTAVPKVKIPVTFDPSDSSALTNLQAAETSLSNWQQLIQNLHDQVSVTLTVGDAIDWGDPNGTINVMSGLPDPTTGAGVTKGIYDRLREIGSPADRARLAMTDTELGLNESLLANYQAQQGTARPAYAEFLKWAPMTLGQIHYLNAAMSSMVPWASMPSAQWSDVTKGMFPTVGQGTTSGSTIKATARDLKNAIAKVARLTKLKQQIPNDRRDRELSLTRRFDALKLKLSNTAALRSYTLQDLSSDLSAGLSQDEQSALAEIPTAKPGDWVGTSTAWDEQAKDERAAVTDEFTGRRAALQQKLATLRYQGALSQRQASTALSETELVDRTAIEDQFQTLATNLTNQSQAITKTNVQPDSTLLKNILSPLTSAYNSATGPSGFGAQLQDLLAPAGSLAINIQTAESIDIPALVQEANSLVPQAQADLAQAGDTTAAGQDQSQLITLLQQQNANLAETLNLKENQTAVLKGMMPLIPSYDTGGPVLNDTLANVHAGEYVVPKGGALVSTSTGSGATNVELHQHYHGNAGALMSLIDQRIQHPNNVRAISRQLGQRSQLLSHSARR